MRNDEQASWLAYRGPGIANRSGRHTSSAGFSGSIEARATGDDTFTGDSGTGVWSWMGGSTACIVLLVGEGSLSSTLPFVVGVGGAATDWALGGEVSFSGGERRDGGGTDDRDML